MTDGLRNRHDREEHHFGEFFATLVGISSTIDAGVTAGMTVEEAIGVIHLRLLVLEDEIGTNGATFTADAVTRATMAGSFAASAVSMTTMSSSLSADASVDG